MTALTFLIVLASSAGWAAFDVLRKRLTAHLRPTPMVVLLTLGMLPLFLAWLAATGGWRLDARYLPPAALAVALNVGANLLFVRAVQIAPLSTTIPMLAFTPAFAAVFSALALRELLTPRALLGIVLVVGGALLLRGGGAAQGVDAPSAAPPSLVLHVAARRTPAPPARRRLLDDGPRLMLGVAFLWALTSVADKAALAYVSTALHAAAQCAGVGAVVLLLLVARGRAGELGNVRAVWGAYAAAVAVSALALALQFVAFRLTYVSTVEAVKRTFGMGASVLTGFWFFGEPLTAHKWAGVATMSSGVALILL